MTNPLAKTESEWGNVHLTPEYQAGYVAGRAIAWREAAEYYIALADWRELFLDVCAFGIDKAERRRRERQVGA